MGRTAVRRPRGTTSTEVVRLREEVARERASFEWLSESIAELERQVNDAGWQRLIAQSNTEFTPDGLRQIREICRLYTLKNPLLRRGVALRTAYVWGQGVAISARANGKQTGQQDVNSVIQSFLDARGNQRAFVSQSAREALERTLATDGEIAIVLFTTPSTGAVQVRTFGADEIAEIRCNPEDMTEPWYYKRSWSSTSYDASGTPVTSTVERWYPAVDYRPRIRPAEFNGVSVAWDSPMIHVKVNGLGNWTRGVPDVYAAVDWTRAYKEFLESWATLMKSLARYAWRAKAPASARAAARTALAATPTLDAAGNPAATGATAILSPDAQLEAISKSGATLDADSGRPLATMVASALDLPVTMLLADPGQTGARATAETLDQPTELVMGMRRSMWGDVLHRICQHVITESVRAPRGALKGKIEPDPYGGEIVTLDGDTDQTVDVDWPSLDDIDVSVLVKAITDASGTGTMRPQDVLRMLLTALGVKDVDSIIDEMLDDDGKFIWPEPPGSTGTRASDAAAIGEDPAAVDGGPMGGDAPDMPDDAEPATGGDRAVDGEDQIDPADEEPKP